MESCIAIIVTIISGGSKNAGWVQFFNPMNSLTFTGKSVFQWT